MAPEDLRKPHMVAWFGLWVFNATVNNISVISLWRSVLLVEETEIP